MSGHKNCCKNQKAPKKASEFAALLYPPNPHHSDILNRIHNPAETGVYYGPDEKNKGGDGADKAAEDEDNALKTSEGRRGWWFFLRAPKPPFLDGSGDKEARGYIYRSEGVIPTDKSFRLVCLNAASLKMLPVPGKSKPQLCGFTWRVNLLQKSDQAPPIDNKEEMALRSGSGWIPLDAIDFKSSKVEKEVRATLKNWHCCMEKYRDWGARLTRKGPRYRFRSVQEVQAEIVSFEKSPAKFDRYFKELNRVGEVRKRVRESIAEGLSKKLGIIPHCQSANKLSDYLPKGSDYKKGDYTDGYTNFCANLSAGPKGSRMAPIALDIFPAGHTFHRLLFKQKKRIWGFLYRIPAPHVDRKPIGCVEWYYGFCDIKGSDPKKKQRRYGWVPALALDKVGN